MLVWFGNDKRELLVKEQKFPVVCGEQQCYPVNGICPVCHKNEVLEPNSMAILSVGALLMDRKNDTGSDSDKLDAFLRLIWHGAHENGRGNKRDLDYAIDVVQSARGGVVDLCFCSTQCLRTFLNRCVDELEERGSD